MGGFVNLKSTLIISFISTIICYFSFYYLQSIKHKIDDTLDVFTCHGISGFLGILLTGVFASDHINPDIVNGVLYGGGWEVLVKQAFAGVLVAAFAMLITFVIIATLRRFMQLRVEEKIEETGLDVFEHGERAYQSN